MDESSFNPLKYKILDDALEDYIADHKAFFSGVFPEGTYKGLVTARGRMIKGRDKVDTEGN